MAVSDSQVRLQKLARTENELAELHAKESEIHAERARLFEGLASGQPLVPEKRERARHSPAYLDEPISELDRERARRALEKAKLRPR